MKTQMQQLLLSLSGLLLSAAMSANAAAPRVYGVGEAPGGLNQPTAVSVTPPFKAPSHTPSLTALPNIHGGARYVAGFSSSMESVYRMDPYGTCVNAAPQYGLVNVDGGGIEDDGNYWAQPAQGSRIGAWDTETWERVYAGPFLSNVQLRYDCAVDPTTNLVYGLIEDSTETRYWAIIDYPHQSAKTLGVIDDAYLAVGFDAQGQCYGVRYGSVFGKIDKNTGEFTDVADLTLSGYQGLLIGTGCVDPKTGIFYWCCTTNRENVRLVAIDTKDGQILGEKVIEHEFYSMWIPQAAAKDKAPAAPSNLQADFKNALSGTVSFQAPTKLFDGTTGSGDLTYVVTVDCKEVAEGSCSWGQNLSLNLNIGTEGMHYLTARCYVNGERGAKAKKTLCLGNDIPAMPENVAATFADGSFTVKWDEVNQGANGGYIDPAEVTYTVTLLPDSKDVATVKGLTTVTVPYDVQGGVQYNFKVVATYNGLTSDAGTSNYVVAGAFTPPYYVACTGSDWFDVFKTINTNRGSTWAVARWEDYAVCDTPPCDDWLVTPGIYLEANHAYKATFKAFSQSPEWKEEVSAAWGDEPTVQGLSHELVPLTTVATSGKSGALVLGDYIIPETTGIYYLGIRCTSKKNVGLWLGVVDITIASGIDARVASAADVKIVPDINGGLDGVINIKVPETNMAGKALEGPLTVTVKRGEMEVNKAENVQPGSTLTLADRAVAEGRYDYNIILSNAYGDAPAVEKSAYYGINLPSAPEDVTVVEDNLVPGEVTMTWKAAANDVDGNPIKADNVTYTIMDQNGKVLAKDIKDTRATFRAIEQGKQDFLNLSVCGTTAAGNGPATATKLLPIGTPYTPEHIESFGTVVDEWGNKGNDYPFYWIEGQANTGFYFRSPGWDNVPESEEGDEGFVWTKHNNGMNVTMVFPKVSLAGVAKPALSFKYYNNNGSSKTNLYIVKVICNGDTTEVFNKAVKDINPGAASSKWLIANVDLKDFAGQTISYTMQVKNVNNQNDYLDHFRIYDKTERNLSIMGITAPTHVVAGNDFDVNIIVKNHGALTAAAYTVKLLLDGTEVASIPGDSLANMEAKTYTINQTLSSLSGQYHDYTAMVTYDGDEDMADNQAMTPVELSVYDLPLPVNFRNGSQAGAESAQLAWDAPALSSQPEEITEGFENATPWSPAPEGWESLDNDKTPSARFNYISIPAIGIYDPETGNYNSSGFFVFNQADSQVKISAGYEETYWALFKAHQGNSYMASMYTSSTDDWLVLPQLCGEAQTIKFFATQFGAEGDYDDVPLEVRYCTGDFSPIASQLITTLKISGGAWKEYEVAVPQGAKWVALRNRAENSPFFMLDDVTFKALSPAQRYPILAYNLYRDGKLVNSGKELTFTDNTGSGDYEYALTVLYPQGESAPVELSVSTGIDALNAAGIAGPVYNIMGIRVLDNATRHDLGTLPAGLYIWRGHKFVIK